MTRTARLARLRDLVAIRRAQQEAARLAVGQAQVAVDEAEAEVRRATDLQADRETGWRTAMSGPTLALERAAAWAGAIARGQHSLAELAQGQSAAETRRSAARSAWRLAHGREESAQDLLDRSARRARRDADEAALAEAADRAALAWRSA